MKFSNAVVSSIVLSITILIYLSYDYLDKEVALYFLAHKDIYKHVGKSLSIAGESQWYIGAGVIGFLYFKYKDKNRLYMNRFLLLLYANVFSGLLSIVLKSLFGRRRPSGLKNGNDEYGFLLFQNFDMGFIEKMKYHFITVFHHPATYASFPSGHSVTVAASFTVLYLLFPRYLYVYITFALILVSGRVLAGDHFIADILAGGVVGVFSTLFIYHKMQSKVENKS